ncbi:hypothetical protein BJY52DRAFT_1227242 [Lactarius psammicola]|nr:hypothetical protein BJY52DRAFT_1227242 [Lactarius psammicola]
MAPDLLPLSHSGSHAACKPRRWRSFLRSNGVLKIGFFSTGFFLTGLIVYVAFFSSFVPSWRLPNWRLPSHFDSDSLELADPKEPLLIDPKLATSAPPSDDVLTLEQIRDIVRYIFEAALLQAELLNRTLVLPSFVYARACEYNITVCADYVTMVNKGDAIGSDEWREMPIEKQMGFRIPISVVVNMTHLRNRQPVITASEYLRLHGQDPERESSSGFWPRKMYNTHPNVFETNKTMKPSLFVIENHWYNPTNTTRVDYIPEAMKRRGKLERHPGPDNYDGSTEYWPPLEPTELSNNLAEAMLSFSHGYPTGLEHCQKRFGFAHLPACIVVGHLKEVVPRSSIRGFRDDYHDVDADVVVLAGQTHLGTKPGAMRFTEELGRSRYASTVVHSLVPPQKVFDLAEVLSSRMRLRTEGRMWMGAHMRRGDFVGFGWAMEMEPEDHIRRVKKHLDAGRSVLVDLHDRGDWTTCDIEGTQPDPEQATLAPPRAGDPFFIATDERDPEALRKIAAAGAVFMSDLLTMEDRRTFGWPLMITDLMAFVEQQLLVHSSYFYGHCMSSFSGVIANMRAARGADPRTMLLD